MPDSQVDEIKSRLDLAEIIRGYMKIEKSGINLRGLCPFHREKTPSFFVSPSRQLWRCFGCSVGGDMFTFISTIEGVDFKDALKILADRAGVALRSYDPKVRSEKSRLYEICEKSCQFFEKQLASSALGQEAREYLLNRGISEESVEKFRIGFAPQTRSALSLFLREQGYSPTEIFKSGVSIQSLADSRHLAVGPYDRFRNRIMFPISDLNNQVIGFGGRVFFAKNQVPDPKLAKYINTPQTLLYDKSKVLYGMDRAKMKIREHDSCMLVEGYTDVIMAHQAGTENVAAVSGTALTEHQLDLVRRYTENLITLFDMDIAGDTATKRGIDLAQKKGFNVKVIVLPEGKDPAEIIQKNEQKWREAIEKPLSIGDFYFATVFSRFDKKIPEGMKNISAVLLPMIKRIPSSIEQSFWVQKLAAEFACNEDVVWRDLEKINVPDSQDYADASISPKIQESPAIKSKKEILYERLLLLATKDRKCFGAITKKDVRLLSQKSVPSAIFLKLYNERERIISEQDLYLKLSDEEKGYLNSIIFADEIFPEASPGTDIMSEFEQCVKSLRRIALQEKLLALQGEMKRGVSDPGVLAEFKKMSVELAKF